MSPAYSIDFIYNLLVIKEAKRWAKHGFILQDQFAKISEAYKTPLYHPNMMIRLLLFVATLVALSGITGILALFFVAAGKAFIAWGCVFYGIGSFVVLEKMFIAKHHFKSGVTEAVLYHACGFVIGGVAAISEFHSPQLIWFTCLLVFSFAAWRYLDLLTTIAAMASLAGILFYNCFEVGGIFKQILPFVFIVSFLLIYFIVKRMKSNRNLSAWGDNLLVVEVIALLLIYVSGNYLVVRELSVSLMGLSLAEGEDIPFALFFYLFTILVPILYLALGIRKKDRVMLRVSLILLAFAVFTFKYYFSLGHTEITLMVAGLILIGLAVWLMHFLAKQRNGFTGEDILSSKWASLNAEAFIISQTMGGNQTPKEIRSEGGGGSFGGGGSTEGF
jgi:uncharacterized membrane protein YgcG